MCLRSWRLRRDDSVVAQAVVSSRKAAVLSTIRYKSGRVNHLEGGGADRMAQRSFFGASGFRAAALTSRSCHRLLSMCSRVPPR